jgi:DNA-binding beta-propeller fold protein YncE
MSAVNPPRRIGVADRSDFRLDEIDVFFPRPHPMVASRTGFAYTGSLGVDQLAAVNLAEESVELVNLEGGPHALVQFALSPDGRTLVAATELSGRLLVFDLADPAKPKLTRDIAIGPMAFDPSYSPDGRSVWVPVKGANEIAIVETSGWTVTRRIKDDGLRQPHAIAFSADGRTAFVSNNNKMDHMMDPAHAGHEMPAAKGALVMIDVASGNVTGRIELGQNLTGMGTRGGR